MGVFFKFFKFVAQACNQFKRWGLANDIAKLTPEHDSYYEPFIGAGYVLHAIYPERAVVSDTNKPLIELWEIIKTKTDHLSDHYEDCWDKLNNVDRGFY